MKSMYTKGNATVITIIIIIIIVIGGIWYMSSRQNDDAQPMPEGTDMSEPMDEVTDAVPTGTYEAYSADKLALAETGDVVLFFHANWCPTCRGLEKNIRDNMSDLPEDVAILKIDYDTATELKQKYGVTFQHTLIQVDAEGNMIKKWQGSPTLAAVLAEIS